MGVFRDQVAGGLLAQPTQREFRPERWESAFNLDTEPDQVDIDLYESGLFFDRILTELRALDFSKTFSRYNRTDSIRYSIGSANRNYAIANDDLKSRFDELKRKPQTVLLSAELSRLVTLPNGIQLSADELFTATIDTIVYPLDQAITGKAGNLTADEHLESDFRSMLYSANAYHVASELWLDCLWNDKKVVRTGANEYRLVPRNPRRAFELAVSVHRKNQAFHAMMSTAATIWRALAPRDRKLLSNSHRVAKFDTTRRGSPFVVVKDDTSTRQKMPPTVGAWLIANQEYLAPFVDFPLPDFPNITPRIAFRAWQALGSAARAIIDSVSDDVTGLPLLLAYAPPVKRVDLVNLLVTMLDCTSEVAAQLLRFFTYIPRTDGLWFRPLVVLSESEFSVAAIPLLTGDMVRAFDGWLKNGGFDPQIRGDKFEQTVRERVAQHLIASDRLKDAECLPTAIFVGGEEVDLVVRIGTLILVGETKSSRYPGSTLEHHDLEEALREAAGQARRKAEAVQRNIDEMSKYFGHTTTFDGVYPFVVSNQLQGSGYSVSDVPVIDLLYLEGLLETGFLRTMVVMSRDGSEDYGEPIRYYYSDLDAVAKMPSLLAQQPIVRVLEPVIAMRTRPLPISPNGVRFYEDYFGPSVGLPSPLDFAPE